MFCKRFWCHGVALCTALAASTALFDSHGAYAQEPGTIAGFEIDGDLACRSDAAGTGIGDDWADNACNGATCSGVVDPVTDPFSSAQFTDCNWGNQGDAADPTQFKTGSNKNCDDISGNGSHWNYVSQGGGPQKNDITNVYVHRRPRCTKRNGSPAGSSFTACNTDADCAGAERCHTWIFVGAETRSTNGDSHLDFEINQAGVRLVPDPDTFDPSGCEHGSDCCDESTSGRIVGDGTDGGGRTIGDISLDMSFRQGGIQPVLTVRRWDGSSYVFVTGQVAGVTVFSQTNDDGNVGAGCTWTGFESNGASTGLGGTIFQLQFVEGAIDQTALGLEFDPCIPNATVLVKSRSSHSDNDVDFCNAQLKDFALFPFPVVPPPPCNATGDEVCEGDTATLTACPEGGVPPFSVVWTDSSGAVVGNCPSVAGGGCCDLVIPSASAADAGTYTATTTDSRGCEGEPCDADLVVNPNPTCDLTNAEVTDAGTITGGTITGGTPPYTCAASFNAASGWMATGCSVSGSDITVNFVIADPANASNTAVLTVTVTDANGCMGQCVQDVGIAVECEAEPAEPICEGESQVLTACVTAGLDGQTIDWFGPFAGVVDCASIALGPVRGTCAGLDVSECCDLVVSPPAGTFSFCAKATEPNGLMSFCRADLLVNPNPTCNVEPPDALICEEETQQFCARPSGGTPPYLVVWQNSAGTELARCVGVPADGECCFTTGVADTYTAFVTDAADCEGECQTRLQVEECPEGCRVTGGGVDCDGQIWHGNEDCNGALGRMKKIDGTDVYTFGGQAGAPTGFQPQPFGEWTHRQHDGPSGRWTFHAGTASAPPGTEIDLITCCDPGFCNPARPAPFKQINFEGVGSFKNVIDAGDVGAVAGSLRWFEVHIEDLGEPGRNGTQRNPPGFCPDGGFNCDSGDCRCPDFYRITIHATDSPASAVVYEVRGYITGGNLQLHPPVGE